VSSFSYLLTLFNNAASSLEILLVCFVVISVLVKIPPQKYKSESLSIDPSYSAHHCQMTADD
jgi:hypothetical protein